MPQMAPMYWIFISPFSLLSFLLILCFLFFNKTYFINTFFQTLDKNNSKTSFSFKW